MNLGMQKTFLFFLCFFLFFFSFPILFVYGQEEGGVGYLVQEKQDRLEVSTPMGKKNYKAEFNLERSRNYFLALPIIKPKNTPEPVIPNREVTAPQKEEKKEKEESVAQEEKKTPALSSHENYERFVVQANRLFHKKKFHEAFSLLDELTRIKPDYPRGWIMKGSVLYKLGYKDLAKASWEKARQLDPENSKVDEILQRYP